MHEEKGRYRVHSIDPVRRFSFPADEWAKQLGMDHSKLLRVWSPILLRKNIETLTRMKPRKVEPSFFGKLNSFGWNTAGYIDSPKFSNESSKKLDYSLSFLNANGLPEESLDTSGDFCRDCNGNPFYVALDELFIRRRNAFLPQDTLTIQCHVKRINSKVPAFIRSTARTRIGVERNLFTWNLSDFSSLRKAEEREIAVESPGGKFSPLTLKLSIVGGPLSEDRIQIEVHRKEIRNESFSKLKISLLNNEKKSVLTIEDEFFLSIIIPSFGSLLLS
ncbi:speckle-type POZ protein B [Caerostris extrusa]|uniref:Speckle-type POZ protein B n=1 Tax=Caerostris extrusa TaxID=172846 RepID=A0AAV4W8M8_CAEEX|nr:speckle-type POZ protein B [Caerostris extrusa]